MFTTDDIKRAHLIVKKITDMAKSASFLDREAFGAPKAIAGGSAMANNPNTWNMPWPKYNEAPPAFLDTSGPKTFMQSVGAMGRGAFNSGMGLASAATLGQRGSNGMLLNAGIAGARTVRDAAHGNWGNIGKDWRGVVSGPMDRFQYNNSQDIQDFKAPYTWWKQPFMPGAMRTLTGGGY